MHPRESTPGRQRTGILGAYEANNVAAQANHDHRRGEVVVLLVAVVVLVLVNSGTGLALTTGYTATETDVRGSHRAVYAVAPDDALENYGALARWGVSKAKW
jgi:hypothetical protein